ncbi:NAD(P)-dependent oxidoreductase [Microtetraspora sp. NBRC 13810]|uniref:SDR family oxidoreductase n=1 Tax=Microtetraspora sp. NBRC 13810 TaxID=3030990 RepID=UPI0024A2B0FB|nr:SDR family oxidoreductase [Microtetraspora sp. NBRC 13810]GLW12768.1 NAD(P)-dependent oxidoreductase [Microtetraspora sp. NBRC 13810]
MILITGANGRPGSAAVREFARQGTPVRALVRDPEKAGDLRALPGVEVAYGDMLWPETLESALAGVDRVLMISSAGPLMLETQCTFIDAAIRAGVGHIVKFSGKDSIDGFDNERFRSSRSHEQIQRYLVASGVPWTVLRPSQFMQVYFEEVPDIVASGELRLPLGDTTLAPIDIEDIARIAYAVLTTPGHEGRTYPMTGPEALTMTDIAGHISDAVGRPVRYRDVTSEEKQRDWLAAGYPPPRASAFAQLFRERSRLGRSTVDLASHEHFGIEPTTFAEFARRNADVFRGATDYTVTPA